MLSEGRAVGDEADGTNNEKDAGPSVEGDVFVQPEVGDEGGDDVRRCSGGKDEGEIGPAKSGKITGEKADQAHDTGQDPRIQNGVNEAREVLKIDAAYLTHATGEQGIAD